MNPTRGLKSPRAASPRQVTTPTAQGRILTLSKARIGDNNIVSGTFLVHATPATILFDSGATNSFIATEFATQLGLNTSTKVRLQVKVASGEIIKCDRMYENVMITIQGVEFPSNLIQFKLDGVQVI